MLFLHFSPREVFFCFTKSVYSLSSFSLLHTLLNPGAAPPLARKRATLRVVDLPVAVPVPSVVVVVVVVPSAPARRGGLGLCRRGGADRRKGKEPVLDLEAAACALLEGVLGGEEAVQALEWSGGEAGSGGEREREVVEEVEEKRNREEEDLLDFHSISTSLIHSLTFNTVPAWLYSAARYLLSRS